MLKIAYAAVLLCAPAVALAQRGVVASTVSPPLVSDRQAFSGATSSQSPAFFEARYRNQLVKIRQEALAYQNSDGGTLSPEHRDAVQKKIDRAHFDMVRQIKNNDRFSLDSRAVER